MDADLSMALGLVIAVVAIPIGLAAFAEGRTPRGGAAVLLVAGGLIFWGVWTSPDGYTFVGLPAVVIEVIARYLR